MEFFLHYITADIKYNFWCEEDGHQFREDWVKCRLNIKHLDSPNIQISCYPVNHLETIPLNINIDFADFHFERAVEVLDKKPNAFALLWTQQNQSSEFYIAIDDENQFKNYEIYLNNLVKICKIAENERLDSQAIEASSISFENLATSSLSLFNSTNDIFVTNMGSIESMENKHIEKEKKFGLLRVKNATKCAAKKFNRMFVKAKSKLIKPSFKHLVNDSVASTCTQFTDVDASFEFEEVDLNDVSTYSSHSTIRADDECDGQYSEKHDLFDNSFNSTIISSAGVSDRSFCRSTKDISSNESSLMHQIFAASIADLRMIYAESELSLVTPCEMSLVKPSDVKKIIRKGTPHKMKMPQRLNEHDEVYSSPESEDIHRNKMTSHGNHSVDAPNLIKRKGFINNYARAPQIFEMDTHFEPYKPKKSIAKRAAQTYRKLYQTLRSVPNFLLSL